MSGYWQNLESRNFVSGGTVAFSMDGLPPKTRVRSLQLSFDLTGIKGTGDVLGGDQFARLVSNVKLGNFFNLSGMDLSRLMWQVNGHVVEDPANYYNIVAGATTFSMYFTLDIYLRDPRTGNSEDGSMPTELLATRGIELTLAAGNVWGVGSLAVTAGVIRCAVERIHETNIPFLNRFGYIDASSQTVRLEPGLYKELLLTKPDGTNILQSDISVVDLVADGRPILQAMRYEQLITAWNRTAMRNGVAGSRSELTKSAGVPFLPLIWHDNSMRSGITKQLLAEKDCFLQITAGGYAAPRVVYWKGIQKDQETLKNIAVAIGAPANAQVYEPQTASKTPPHTDHTTQGDGKQKTKHRVLYGFLPGKFRTSVTPGNKAAGG